MDWTRFVKHGFVKYGIENKYFVILFLDEIFLGLILFGLSIPTPRKFLWWLHLPVNCYRQFSNFSTLYNTGSSFLIHSPLSLKKERSIQDAQKWKNSLTFDQNNFASFKKSAKVCIPRVEMAAFKLPSLSKKQQLQLSIGAVISLPKNYS